MEQIIPYSLANSVEGDNFMHEYTEILGFYFDVVKNNKRFLTRLPQYDQERVKSVVEELVDVQALSRMYSSRLWDLPIVYCPLAQKYRSILFLT